MATAFRFALARSATRHKTAVPPAESESKIARAPHTAWRSIEFLLAGESVKSNRHLRRFASAPFLARLLGERAFDTMLNRKSKQLRKEIIEAYVVIEALESVYSFTEGECGVCSGSDFGDGNDRNMCDLEACASVETAAQPPSAIVDLCCGKGFLSLLLALEHPWLPIVLVDSNPLIKMDHVAALPNLTFMRADIGRREFTDELVLAIESATQALSAGAPLAARDRAFNVGLVGMHLCGPLSPRAIDIFGQTASFGSLVLVPCCLDPRTDLALKLKARQEKVDPYDLKVLQLRELLETAAAGIEVRVSRDTSMRTSGGGESSEASAGCKNALIVGRRQLVSSAG